MIVRTSTCVFILSACAAAGCSQEIEGSAPSGNVWVNEGSEALQVAFEDFYSATGRMRIYRNLKGEVAMSVTGAIGKDDPAAIRKGIDPSFVVTYQNLHGVAKVPDRLIALEKERQPVRTRPAEARLAEARLAEARAPELPLGSEDETAFRNATCHTFCNVGGWKQVPAGCTFVANDTWVHAPFAWPHRLETYEGDVSFFWNMTSGGAHHSLWHQTFHYNNYPIASFNWGWNNWPASNPPGYPYLSKDSGSGELGVTTHWAFGGACP
jgi:hypothetical protein